MSPALAAFELLEVAGPDAERFLQSQLASDLRPVSQGSGQFSAWLNPQGRVVAFFPLFRLAPDAFVLAIAFGRSTELAERLRRFVFRSKVTIRVRPDLIVRDGASVPESVLAGLNVPGSDTRHFWLQASSPDSPSQAQPGVADIAAGLPFLDATRSELFIGHALGLKRLGAISVGKGCYPGQEIVARTHFLGRNKRALCRLSGLDPNQTDHRILSADSGQPLGELALAIGGDGLAVLHEPQPGMAITDAAGRHLVLEQVFADS
ncbi:folate-binding protein YgfZ [Ahniella affigens]|uniref:Folate-binding protein YgfZ n=1 Tax=Ahniella affigens TaxID=2021234 RepID=A0A2P1PQ97_9GAMM|nr:folate-binding protein YgfZ [Ahniella affigens]AVP97010.1 folate-binding protein YgfZ [Ahniella affigens]